MNGEEKEKWKKGLEATADNYLEMAIHCIQRVRGTNVWRHGTEGNKALDLAQTKLQWLLNELREEE